MTISQIAVQRYSPGDTAEGTFQDFTIRLGLTDQDMLGSSFEDNLIPGTGQTAFYRDSVILVNSPDEWVYFTLDSPFWYNGSDNLIIEFLWSEGYTEDSCMYSWHWESGSIRSITGEYDDDTGTMSSLVIMFRLQGDMTLSNSTFGEIKTILGS